MSSSVNTHGGGATPITPLPQHFQETGPTPSVYIEPSSNELSEDSENDEEGEEEGQIPDGSRYSVVLRVRTPRVPGRAKDKPEPEQTILIALHSDFDQPPASSTGQDDADQGSEAAEGGGGGGGQEEFETPQPPAETGLLTRNESGGGDGGSRERPPIIFHLFHNAGSLSTTTWRVAGRNYVPPQLPDWEWLLEEEEDGKGRPTVDLIERRPLNDTVLEGGRLLAQDWLDKRFEDGAHIDTPQQPRTAVDTPERSPRWIDEVIKILQLSSLLVLLINWFIYSVDRITYLRGITY
ncbi:hypothetical protein F5Y11DRAFT_344342 [Daldinia sp. FL1419]|nr:hypothetical protein F5Y11DRAFT_344342 [Daldinia sp. FL1419]